MVCFFSHICLLTLGISFFCSEGTSILEFTLFGSCIGFLFQNEEGFILNAKLWKATTESNLRVDNVS